MSYIKYFLFTAALILSSFSLHSATFRSPSLIYIKDSKLFVHTPAQEKRTANIKPFIIKGVTWSPATRAPAYGPDPRNKQKEVQYGYFFDWPGRNPPGHLVLNYWLQNEFIKYYKQDINLMKELGVNTVRIYSSFGDDQKTYTTILDEFYNNQIMVIITVAISKADFESERYLRTIRYYKDHPSILMWALGNEWNLDYNKYWGYKTVEEAAVATNIAAKKIKKIDKNHPVTSILGDRFTDPKKSNRIEYILSKCPEIDIWGINIYRGNNFGSLFDQWNEITSKPFYISEFGTDSFFTESYKIQNDYQAIACRGKQDQNLQAKYLITLWEEVRKNLSVFNTQGKCVGAIVHEFNDELWKVGSYHLGLGDLVDYYSSSGSKSYRFYNNQGYYLNGGHPDNVSNEEHFGLVTAERVPKKSFYFLKEYFKKLEELEDLYTQY